MKRIVFLILLQASSCFGQHQQPISFEREQSIRMDMCSQAETTLVTWLNSIGTYNADIDTVLDACAEPPSDPYSDECTMLVEDCGY